MHRKLIFLDIDGTLTPAGTNVPPDSALAAIRAAQRAGHRVFLCSGRNLGMLSPVLAYGFEGAVCSAGGYVFAGDRVLFDCPMTQEEQETAMRTFAEGGVLRTLETRDGSYADDDLAAFLAEGPSEAANSEFLRWRRIIHDSLSVRSLAEYDGQPAYKFVFMCRREAQLLPARKALEHDFNFCLQAPDERGLVNGELINRKFDKGKGVRVVAEAFGFDIADTIGFGDSMNDLEMIETVGLSVCMANGNPLLKERSAMVCPSVEEDGLARAFAQLGLTA